MTARTATPRRLDTVAIVYLALVVVLIVIVVFIVVAVVAFIGRGFSGGEIITLLIGDFRCDVVLLLAVFLSGNGGGRFTCVGIF